jgi:two-component system, chemotaxis family, sensor kinase CheA
VSFGGFDQEIVQDFLTESGELLEQLEGDLVSLESRADDLGLINQVFRALHTIKGSASFLGLTNLVQLAHAAEGALNSARNSTIVVDRSMMDLLLRAVDTLKVQFDDLRSGRELTAPDPALVHDLTELAEGRQSAAPTDSGADSPDATVADSGSTASTRSARAGEAPLILPPGKVELLEFLRSDLNETMAAINDQVRRASSPEQRAGACAELSDTSSSLCRCAEFFNFDSMTRLANAVRHAAEEMHGLDAASLAQAFPRVRAVVELLRRQCEGINAGVLRSYSADALIEQLRTALSGGMLDAASLLAPDADVDEILKVMGVLGLSDTTAADAASPQCTPAIAPETGAGDSAPDQEPEADAETRRTSPTAQRSPGATAQNAPPGVEQTIRVEVGRLETLMNLVGELVLQKNRMAALSRQVQQLAQIPQTLRESVALATGGLDRVTSDIQMAVMRTRMQPLEKLFGKYPRLIRDLAGKTGKKIALLIEGGETEVDKSVIEELADPLIHILRNSADHGIELPAERIAAAKPECGTIRIAASQEGDHVRLRITDDGRGLHRTRIAAKAVERGLVSQDAVEALSDRDVFNFIFLPGFSTADKLSDLSGRGVGMDVVRTNILKLKGSIDVASTHGSGTTVTITIPLTVAILPAMLVGLGSEVYAIPLNNILEIVRPEADQINTIGESPVMRLRDTVLPLVNGLSMFNVRRADDSKPPFTVVLSFNERRLGLMVTKLIGQQEIVIKALDGTGSNDGPVSGATVRDDGGVSLIMDVARMFEMVQPARQAA